MKIVIRLEFNSVLFKNFPTQKKKVGSTRQFHWPTYRNSGNLSFRDPHLVKPHQRVLHERSGFPLMREPRVILFRW